MNALYHDTPTDSQPPLTEKKCSKCKKVRPIDCFHKDSHQSTGYRNACIDCLKKGRKRTPLHKLKLTQWPLFEITKVCNECGIEKSIDEFTTGETKCRECRNKQSRQRVERQLESSDIPPTRICAICQKEKSTTEDFYKHSHGPYGYARECKDCADKRKRQWDIENIDHVRAQRQASYDPEEKREYNQAYYEANQERLKSNSHLYYDTHREEQRAKGKAWQQANLIKCKESNDRRRALKRNAIVEKVDYQFILERDAGYCYICEKDVLQGDKINFDHVIPLARGGAHAEWNIKLTHAICNNRKYFRLLEEMTPFQRRGIR